MTRRLPLKRRYPTTPITPPRAIFGPPETHGDYAIQRVISFNFIGRMAAVERARSVMFDPRVPYTSPKENP